MSAHRILADVLIEATGLGVKTDDVSATVRWSIARDALSDAQIRGHVQTLRSRIFTHNQENPQ